MAVLSRHLAPKPTISSSGVAELMYYVSDTYAERPVTGLNDGDLLYCLDTDKLYIANSSTTWAGQLDNTCVNQPSGGFLPTGCIVMWHGLLSAIPSGWHLCDGTSGTPDLRSKFVKGTAAGVDPGATGGALTHTHASHSNLVHSGTAVADHAAHTHSVTSNVAVDAHAGTAVSAHAGTAVADHASHTHTYTDVINHTHTQTWTPQLQGGTTAATTGTHIMTSTATGGSLRSAGETTVSAATANPGGGVATGTTAAPSATLTHSVTQPSNHTVTQPNNHTVTNNAVTSGNPSATLTHSVTQPSDHSISAHDTVNHEPPYYTIAYIMKT